MHLLSPPSFAKKQNYEPGRHLGTGNCGNVSVLKATWTVPSPASTKASGKRPPPVPLPTTSSTLSLSLSSTTLGTGKFKRRHGRHTSTSVSFASAEASGNKERPWLSTTSLSFNSNAHSQSNLHTSKSASSLSGFKNFAFGSRKRRALKECPSIACLSTTSLSLAATGFSWGMGEYGLQIGGDSDAGGGGAIPLELKPDHSQDSSASASSSRSDNYPDADSGEHRVHDPHKLQSLGHLEQEKGCGRDGRFAFTPGTKKIVALKVILKKHAHSSSKVGGGGKRRQAQAYEACVRNEFELLRGLDHPNIIQFYEYFESRKKYYLCLELCEGGDLFDRACLPGTRFGEGEAVWAIRSILTGLAYLHDQGIAHRDIKPENVLYRTKERDSELVIADFETARRIPTDWEDYEEFDPLQKHYTTSYAAPERLYNVDHCGSKADVWSVGVMAYTLLCGNYPFNPPGDESVHLVKKNQKNLDVRGELNWEVNPMYERVVTVGGKAFVKSILISDPGDRPTAAEALTHWWLTTTPTHPNSTPSPNSSPSKTKSPKQRWRTAINGVRAGNRFMSRPLERVKARCVVEEEEPLSEDASEEQEQGKTRIS